MILPENTSFFVVLSTEELTKVKEKSIPYMNYHLGMSGYIFDGTKAEEVMAILGSSPYKFESTPVEGLVRMERPIPTVSAPPVPAVSAPVVPPTPVPEKLYKVSVGSFGDHSNIKKKFSEILEPFAELIKKNIVWCVPHGGRIERTPDLYKFNVYIWASTKHDNLEDGHRYCKTPSTLFGHDVGCTDQSFFPEGTGVPIIDDTCEYTAAELFPESLFIHFDASHHNTDSTVDIFREIINRCQLKYKKHFIDNEPLDYVIPLFHNPIRKDNGIVKSIRKSISENFKVPGNIFYCYTSDDNTPINHAKAFVTNKDIFRINIGYSENPTKATDKELSFYGVPYSRGSLIMPSGYNCFQIRENDLIISEAYGQTINVLLKNIHTSSYNVLDEILKRTLAFYNLSQAEQIETIKKLVSTSEEESEKFFIKNLKEKREHIIKTTKNAIDKLQEKIKLYQNTMVESIRESDALSTVLDNVTHGKDYLEDKSKKEMKTILRNKKVYRLKCINSKIIVTTNNLYCKHPKTDVIYDVGIFDITICANPTEAQSDYLVVFRNLKYPQAKRPAPHVYNDGHACLGNIQKILPELLGKYEYSTVVDLAIQFLESVNPDDSFGREIENICKVFYDPKKDRKKVKKVPPMIDMTEEFIFKDMVLPKPLKKYETETHRTDVERIIEVEESEIASTPEEPFIAVDMLDSDVSRWSTTVRSTTTLA